MCSSDLVVNRWSRSARPPYYAGGMHKELLHLRDLAEAVVFSGGNEIVSPKTKAEMLFKCTFSRAEGCPAGTSAKMGGHFWLWDEQFQRGCSLSTVLSGKFRRLDPEEQLD